MKKSSILILAGAPLVLIAVFYFADSRQSSTSASQSAKQTAMQMQPHKQVPSNLISISPANDSNFKTALAQSEETRTAIAYAAANRESSINVEGYPSQQTYLLKKHKACFDTWNLMETERYDAVKVVEQYTRELAKAFQVSAVSWPLEVGHAANVKANSQHTALLLQKSQALRLALKEQLGLIAGSEFASQFMRENYPSPIQRKYDD